MSDSLQSHRQQHTSLPCPSPTPKAYSNSYPSSQWCHPSSHPLSAPSPPAFNLSQHQGLFNESALHIRCPKYGSFSISPSKKYSGLISPRIDWFGLLAVRGTLKSFLQHNLKTSILWCPAFFMVQLSHLYMTTGKTKALTFVSKVMSLLLNILFRFVIAFFS